jgi:hypothetical protein
LLANPSIRLSNGDTVVLDHYDMQVAAQQSAAAEAAEILAVALDPLGTEEEEGREVAPPGADLEVNRLAAEPEDLVLDLMDYDCHDSSPFDGERITAPHSQSPALSRTSSALSDSPAVPLPSTKRRKTTAERRKANKSPPEGYRPPPAAAKADKSRPPRIIHPAFDVAQTKAAKSFWTGKRTAKGAFKPQDLTMEGLLAQQFHVIRWPEGK